MKRLQLFRRLTAIGNHNLRAWRGLAAAFFSVALLAGTANAQEAGAPNFHVTKYTITAQLYPSTHILDASAKIELTPQANLSELDFQLNSALRVQKVVDASGQDVPYQQQGLTLRLMPANLLPSGQPTSVTVSYKGSLGSAEGSPIEGLQLAYVGPEGSYLLYPGRWFPVVAPGLDRFAASLHITVPSGETAIASGTASAPVAGNGTVTYSFDYDRPSFPGSVFAGKYTVQHETAFGADVALYLQAGDENYAADYGAEAAKILNYFSNTFGSLPNGNLALVEIPNGTVGGYSAPGVVALAARGFTEPVNSKLLAHEISRQWWRCLVSPATPNDAFLDDGLSLYSMALLVEKSEGEAAFESLMNQTAIGALTHEEAAPITQAGSLQPFTPEYHSIVAQKGAMVFHMLRGVIGAAALQKTLEDMVREYAWKSITTSDFQKLAENASHQKLTYFFAQWVSSTGVPQFKSSWAIYRVDQHYQVVGKIQQDLDIFRMPVDVRVYSEGRRPVDDRVDMVGTKADFTVNTVTRPTRVEIDPGSNILKLTPKIKIEVELARGDQLVAQQAYLEAIKQYQKVVEENRNNSLAHFRMGQVYFTLHNYSAAAEELRAALDGNLQPKWIEVWSHLTLGKIFDVTGQRDRAINEYQRALQTKDNTQGALDQANKYIQKPYTEPSHEIK